MGAAAISSTVAAHPRSDVNTPVIAGTSTTALRIGADVSAKLWLSVKLGTPGAKSSVFVYCRLKKNLNARINVSLDKIHLLVNVLSQCVQSGAWRDGEKL